MTKKQLQNEYQELKDLMEELGCTMVTDRMLGEISERAKNIMIKCVRIATLENES